MNNDITIREVTRYMTSDDREFESAEEASYHQQFLNITAHLKTKGVYMPNAGYEVITLLLGAGFAIHLPDAPGLPS